MKFDRFNSLNRKPVWDSGVIEALDKHPRSYIINSGGVNYRINRVHIKPRNTDHYMPVHNDEYSTPSLDEFPHLETSSAMTGTDAELVNRNVPSHPPRTSSRARRSREYLKDFVT